ncbi:DNA polymerase III subunit chi [Comamonas testosteroni]|uniref:DNA polymerase III subunit chi n=1 Tax=Comamonas testosteroni TaxID=285 RepID=A0A373FAS9_COMTE|nr:DNA polymerase III subunit chi [Comamonas testosteroni]RGE41160.1 DNA polymerase III subunit chi [Comamonas testosteroni]
MTEIAFHFNAPDKLAYVCRFARKALRHGARLVVLGEEPALTRLSSLLWSVSPVDFLAHARQADGAPMVEASPIVLAQQLKDLPHHDVLVNLTHQLPEGFERFARVVEVVSSTDDMDRHDARERWRDYTARGFAIVRHDLNLKG